MTDEPVALDRDAPERGEHGALLAVAMVLNRALTPQEKHAVAEYLETSDTATFAGAIRTVAKGTLTPWEEIVYEGMFSGLVTAGGASTP